MSKLPQRTVPAFRLLSATAAETVTHLPAARRRVSRLLLGVGAVVISWLGACSEDKARRPDSAPPTTSPASAAATPDEAAAPDAPPGRASGQYLVVAETAYFFSSPDQAKSTGRYLLRGDVVYGEGESGGFVKTRFKTPNGAIVAGWLKANELSRLSSRPAAAQPSAPPRPAQTSAQPETAAEPFSYELEPAPAAAPARAVGTRTAIVQAARSYFYNSPDLSQPRKAHCVQGDKVRLGEEQGEAVYVRFTNWEKVTTTGWMRKDALRYDE